MRDRSVTRMGDSPRSKLCSSTVFSGTLRSRATYARCGDWLNELIFLKSLENVTKNMRSMTRAWEKNLEQTASAGWFQFTQPLHWRGINNLLTRERPHEDSSSAF